MSNYYICYQGGSGEIEEKKSKFIATVKPVHNEQEALDMIASLKKQYWDANHNCYAYITGDRGQLSRCSDDGEPSQTAGRPMMDVIEKNGIRDICVVVTRYFGGTLLGTGGLVRAYQKATIAGIEASTIVLRSEGYRITYDLNYEIFPKIEYMVKQEGFMVFGSDFTDRVRYVILVDEDMKERWDKKIVEISAGKVKPVEVEKVFYANVNGIPTIL